MRDTDRWKFVVYRRWQRIVADYQTRWYNNDIAAWLYSSTFGGSIYTSYFPNTIILEYEKYPLLNSSLTSTTVNVMLSAKKRKSNYNSMKLQRNNSYSSGISIFLLISQIKPVSRLKVMISAPFTDWQRLTSDSVLFPKVQIPVSVVLYAFDVFQNNFREINFCPDKSFHTVSTRALLPVLGLFAWILYSS